MPQFTGVHPDHVPRARARMCVFCTLARLTAVGLAILASLPAARAMTQPVETGGLCDAAALAASRAEDVPIDVLRAVTRVETGRQVKSALVPWPWTVNMEGAGRWFSTEDEARAFVFSHFKRGARSFDVGCFQVNYKWHGAAFQSIDEMFDPVLNARYAARFLRKLFEELGDWTRAAGAYHSRTPEFADRYTRKFEQIRSALGSAPDMTPVAQLPPVRRAPALLARRAPLVPNGTAVLGSLVSMPSVPRRAFLVLSGN